MAKIFTETNATTFTFILKVTVQDPPRDDSPEDEAMRLIVEAACEAALAAWNSKLEKLHQVANGDGLGMRYKVD